MGSIKTEELTPFGQVALKLDHDFSELARLSGQIERLDIQSDGGLERAVRILGEFARHGQSIAEGIQKFSASLQEAREKSEAAAKIVAERAVLVQQRKEEQARLQEKLGALGEKVKRVSETLAAFRRPVGEPFTAAEKSDMTARLESLDASMIDFIEEAQVIQQEAGTARLKSIERNAESLFGTLQAARRKLNSVITPATHH